MLYQTILGSGTGTINLPPFSLRNVRNLYAQYTEETNQPFTEEAVKKVYQETAGQPWLVNRLGAILTLDIKPETINTIDEQDVEKAMQLLLKEKNDHFDNLYEKAKLYKETFVEIVFDHIEYNQYDEEQSWLEQYGLIKNIDGYAVVANWWPIDLRVEALGWRRPGEQARQDRARQRIGRRGGSGSPSAKSGGRSGHRPTPRSCPWPGRW